MPAAFLFIRRVTETTQITSEAGYDEDPGEDAAAGRAPKGVMVYRVFGAFLFGAADTLETALQRAQQEPAVLILRMRQARAMDATGIAALADLAERLQKRGKYLLLCGPHSQPLFAMDRAGLLDTVGRDNVCATMEESLARARNLMNVSNESSAGDVTKSKSA